MTICNPSMLRSCRPILPRRGFTKNTSCPGASQSCRNLCFRNSGEIRIGHLTDFLWFSHVVPDLFGNLVSQIGLTMFHSLKTVKAGMLLGCCWDAGMCSTWGQMPSSHVWSHFGPCSLQTWILAEDQIGSRHDLRFGIWIWEFGVDSYGFIWIHMDSYGNLFYVCGFHAWI